MRILALLLIAAAPVALRLSAAQAPAPAPPQSAQRRDAAPAAKGTASIAGRVTNLDTGEPIAKVTVWAMHFGRHQGARKLIPFFTHEECCLRGSHATTDESGQYS